MRTRSLIAIAAGAAVAIPAVAVADGLGPHSTWYDQHPKPTKPENDVSIIVHRNTSKADLTVTNFCLGSNPGGPSGSYPSTANAQGVRVRHGKISDNGKATLYGQQGQQEIPMRFAATLTSKNAAGTAMFPGTACHTIHFKAKLAKRTR